MTTNFKSSTDFSVTKKISLQFSLKSTHFVLLHVYLDSVRDTRDTTFLPLSKLGYIALPMATTVDLVRIDVIGAGARRGLPCLMVSLES